MREIVEKILNEKTSGTHLFPVNVEVARGRISIFIDGDCGVNLNECAQINRSLHRSLEEMNIDAGEYIVEVSSPGFDRDLNGDIRSLKKNVGRQVQIRDRQGKYAKGILAYVDDNGIMLAAKGQEKIKKLINYSEIKEAKAVI